DTGTITFPRDITYNGTSFIILYASSINYLIRYYDDSGTYTGMEYQIQELDTVGGIFSLTYESEYLWINNPINSNVLKYNQIGEYQNISFSTDFAGTAITSNSSGFYVSNFSDAVYEYKEVNNTYKTAIFTKTISEDEKLTGIWNCQVCNTEDQCFFADDNFTLTVDDAPPTVVVEAPNGTLDNNIVGDSEELNVTFTDENLNECWYNYNGTNISIDGCVSGVKNSTTFILVDKSNMTIYANDSFNNLLSEFIEWQYLFFESNTSFESNVTETSRQEFEISITTIS
ncbi:unnamed protein product, partial [marine sediment metagenome]